MSFEPFAAECNAPARKAFDVPCSLPAIHLPWKEYMCSMTPMLTILCVCSSVEAAKEVILELLQVGRLVDEQQVS